MRSRWTIAVWIVGIGAFAALNYLPIVEWIPGGRFAKWYGTVAADWVYGSAIAVGGGLVLAILSRHVPALWRAGIMGRVMDGYSHHPAGVVVAAAVLGLAAYLVVAFAVQGGRPIHLDEIMQVYQGRTFATGSLTRPEFAYPEFFNQMFLVSREGRLFSQFPPGGPAMLALGSLVGAEWLVQPLAGSLAVIVFGSLVRHLDPRPEVRLGALLLLAFAPFMAFMAGSHMNHTVTLLWLLVGVTGLARAVESSALLPGLVSGLGFGIAATIRPGDALAFALPAGLWFLWRALRPPHRWGQLAAAGLGVAAPMAVLMWVNTEMTGAPLRFGYSVLWGSTHDLGFHSTPWGAVHTPLRGLEQINLYFLTIQRYLFETPFPAVLPMVLALALLPRLRPMDRYLLASGALLVLVYFAYFHNGVYLGPRFLHPLLPVLVLWTARFPGLIRERFGAGLGYRTAIYGYAIAGAIALAVGVPLRAGAHAANLVTTRWDVDALARRHGVTDALVLVPESWGSQLLARLWALDVGRPEAELLYAGVDRCQLERAISAVEERGLRASRAFTALLPELADSGRLVRPSFTADLTAKLLPNALYTPVCLERIRDEQAGFTATLPLLLADGAGNVYARHLHARDTLLLQAYPDRPVFLLKPTGAEVGAELEFTRLSRDSLLREWRGR